MCRLRRGVKVLRQEKEILRKARYAFGSPSSLSLVPSMGRSGSALDNAISESFVATLKVEVAYSCCFPTREAANSAIFEYLEAFYNRRRLHSLLRYVSPEGFEDLGTKEVAVA